LGDLLISTLRLEGVDVSRFKQSGELETSATAVLMNDRLEHIFAYKPGANEALDRTLFDANLDFIGTAEYILVGYYGLLPLIEPVFDEVLRDIQSTGCGTALDCAGGGGRLQPLDRCLPFLDIYIPTRHEAESQTELSVPQDMIKKYRDYGASGIVGIKLGEEGVLLSPAPGECFAVAATPPPARVVNTTGAGDGFYAGFISGLTRGMDVEQAARLGTATASWSITGLGATDQLKDFATTMQLLSD
jgi:sugar/nucleoside kinase (ribokinase family)